MPTFTAGAPRSTASIPPPPEHGINLWLPTAARAVRLRGATEAEALAYLRAQESALRRPYQAGEVERAVALIYGTETPTAPRTPAKGNNQRKLRNNFRPHLLAQLAARLPEANADWFKARSPLCVDRGPERYLHAMSNAGDAILCFSQFKSQGQHIWRNHGGLCLTNGPLERWRHGLDNGAWFLPQPITGDWLYLDRLKSEHNPDGRTRRAEECVTLFRFALLESDEANPAHWLAALAQLPLPIASVVTSGGNSIHSLVLVNAPSKAAWDSVMRGQLFEPLTRLGADPAALTAVRLTRLPSVHRNGRLQELLYLNPAPSFAPIASQPINLTPAF